jgi:hypothetical protein
MEDGPSECFTWTGVYCHSTRYTPVISPLCRYFEWRCIIWNQWLYALELSFQRGVQLENVLSWKYWQLIIHIRCGDMPDEGQLIYKEGLVLCAFCLFLNSASWELRNVRTFRKLDLFSYLDETVRTHTVETDRPFMHIVLTVLLGPVFSRFQDISFGFCGR